MLSRSTVIALARRALAIQRETEHHLEQARALRVLGEALAAAGDTASATECLREARQRFDLFGSPEADEIESSELA
jgi:hypothetical protein